MSNVGLSEITNVRIGKHITLEVEATNEDDAKNKVDSACQQLLCNQIMEDMNLLSQLLNSKNTYNIKKPRFTAGLFYVILSITTSSARIFFQDKPYEPVHQQLTPLMFPLLIFCLQIKDRHDR